MKEWLFLILLVYLWWHTFSGNAFETYCKSYVAASETGTFSLPVFLTTSYIFTSKTKWYQSFACNCNTYIFTVVSMAFGDIYVLYSYEKCPFIFCCLLCWGISSIFCILVFDWSLQLLLESYKTFAVAV